MPVESNKPIQRVHNGGDGIWDGAAWGAAAGAGATAVAYGAGVKWPANAEKRIYNRTKKRMEEIISKNESRIAEGKSHMNHEQLKKKVMGHGDRGDRAIERMAKLGQAGDFAFGSKKRMVASAATGLLGGMVGGAAIDHFR